MNKDDFNFNLRDTKSPYTVIEQSLAQIEDVTQSYVSGHIEEYKGDLEIKGLDQNLKQMHSVLTFDNIAKIQHSLGVQGDEKKQYEIFLAVKGLEHYKYRLFFIVYGSISYPAKIILNESLSQELESVRGIISIQSMLDLEDFLHKIFDLEAIKNLIQELIFEALRMETD